MTEVGRNEPCPCGSGKRYKHCHGALGAPAGGTADDLAKRGFAAHQRNDLDAAEGLYREALALAPEHAGALHYLGVVLYQRKRLAEALPLLDRSVELVPEEPEFHNNRGLALAALQRPADAIAAYRRALSIKPDHATAWNNLGLVLHASGDVSGAIDAYGIGLRIAPDFPQMHWNLALSLLLTGDYPQGWAEYEWRLKCPELYANLPRYEGPRWSGDDPAGRTLLLTAEQGLGDTLQMLRFAQAIAARGARVIVAVQRVLQTLAATVPGVTAAYAEHAPLPPYDAQVSLMSLPGVLGVAPEDVGVTVPYIQPDLRRLREAAGAVEREAAGSRRIGVAWSGARDNTNDAVRSMSLAALAPLLEMERTRWFSLKWAKDPLSDADRAYGHRLVELDLRNDFDGLAALVASLDLVITVDTSLAHLAGALGKPVWILLPRVPDWRWRLEGQDTPWYPTVRLFRQEEAGDWSAPVREIALALRGI